ncbi:MAG: type II toxin-antitoxin system death-on-curing family toxin [Sporomusa sp.]
MLVIRAYATFGGNDLYETMEAKIAVTVYSLVSNHGFVDGNKRIGIAAMLLLLQLNGYKLQYSQQELIDLGLGLAAGNLDENDIQQWIKTHRQLYD